MERRQTDRVKLMPIDFATAEINSAYTLYGTIANIGPQGIKIEWFPHSPGSTPASGDSICFTNTPDQLKNILFKKNGKIVWTKGQECGIHLSSPVAEDNFSLQKKLQICSKHWKNETKSCTSCESLQEMQGCSSNG